MESWAGFHPPGCLLTNGAWGWLGAIGRLIAGTFEELLVIIRIFHHKRSEAERHGGREPFDSPAREGVIEVLVKVHLE